MKPPEFSAKRKRGAFCSACARARGLPGLADKSGAGRSSGLVAVACAGRGDRKGGEAPSQRPPAPGPRAPRARASNGNIGREAVPPANAGGARCGRVTLGRCKRP